MKQVDKRIALIIGMVFTCMALSLIGCRADTNAEPASPAPTGEVWEDCPGSRYDRKTCSGCTLGNWWAERGSIIYQTIKNGAVKLESAPGDCVPVQR